MIFDNPCILLLRIFLSDNFNLQTIYLKNPFISFTKYFKLQKIVDYVRRHWWCRNKRGVFNIDPIIHI